MAALVAGLLDPVHDGGVPDVDDEGERRGRERLREYVERALPAPRRTAWHRRYRRYHEEGRRAARRSGELVRRFRRPLAALALAAAAVPGVKAAKPAAPKPPPAPRAQAPTAVPGGLGLENRVGRVWAAARAESARAALVEDAVDRYEIPRDLAEDIHDEAVRADIDPEVAYGLVKTESSFRHRAVSHVGARGLTQVMPRTARWLDSSVTNEDLFDRTTNLRLGFSYLRDLIDKYNGNLRLALLAYNRGPGTVDRVLDRGGDPDNGYADMVLRG